MLYILDSININKIKVECLLFYCYFIAFIFK